MLKTEKMPMVFEMSNNIVEYFTKYTDYMVHSKVHTKDMAVSRLYLQPFKWHLVAIERSKLGRADTLLAEIFNSNLFWDGMKDSHAELKLKYPCCDQLANYYEKQQRDLHHI